MLKTILSLRSDFAAVGSIIKLYGLQVYHNEIYVYNMHCPINNISPTFHAFLDMQIKPFMDEIVEVKVGPMTATL
ncbi:hypothetical protein PS6_002989 [Mucor atramentarius]